MRLIYYRASTGLSQKKAARKIGVVETTVRNIEHNRNIGERMKRIIYRLYPYERVVMNVEYCEFLLRYRAYYGLNQDEIANKLKVTRRTIDSIEHGEEPILFVAAKIELLYAEELEKQNKFTTTKLD